MNFFKSKSVTVAERQKIAKDTIERTIAIIQEHAATGASDNSVFISSQLPPLDPSACPNPSQGPIKVAIVNSDSFMAARNILKRDPAAKGKTAVLNLASDEIRAGGWEFSLSKTQEEALCYSSTLYVTLKETYYPWPNVGSGSVAGIYSPGVVVFKDDLDHGCTDLSTKDRCIVSVITVAAPRGPKLTDDGLDFKKSSVLEDLKGKIRLVYRMAAHNGQQYLVLGAMGCGAYCCPPRLVADQMKSILLEPEFKGWFRNVTFAVYSTPQIGMINFETFSEVFKNVQL